MSGAQQRAAAPCIATRRSVWIDARHRRSTAIESNVEAGGRKQVDLHTAVVATGKPQTMDPRPARDVFRRELASIDVLEKERDPPLPRAVIVIAANDRPNRQFHIGVGAAGRFDAPQRDRDQLGVVEPRPIAEDSRDVARIDDRPLVGFIVGRLAVGFPQGLGQRFDDLFQLFDQVPLRIVGRTEKIEHDGSGARAARIRLADDLVAVDVRAVVAPGQRIADVIGQPACVLPNVPECLRV
ncbi:hypothetical protein L0Z14_22075 [Burkholderia multivorans]|nr:hypothetical protein [Burkholderia multivorans]MCL4663610.1 hypothetical protein [Burkholderia multivorans]